MNFLKAGLLLLLLLTAGIHAEQKRDDFIFPSEDELFESYLTGEISFEEYLLILDIISNNIKHEDLNLTDELPLFLLHKFRPNIVQSESDNVSLTNQPKPTLIISHAYSSYLEENARSRYQTNSKYSKDNIKANLTIRREYSGRERIIDRYILLSDVSDHITEIRIGNFTKKFGLGTIIGYHGKNVSFSDVIDRESLFFPDYGGQNGIYINGKLNSYRLQSLTSFVRDDQFMFVTQAASLSKKIHRTELAVNTAITSAENRTTKTKIFDLKTSLFADHRISKNRFKAELTFEKIEQKSEFSFIFENKIRSRQFQIDINGWFYSSDFVDLTGGGKTSILSESQVLDKIGYQFSSKRTDQKGVETSVKTDLTKTIEIYNSFFYAYKSVDSTEIQTFSQILKRLDELWTFSYDFSYREKERFSITDGSYIKRIHRLTAKMQTISTYLRTYLLYESKTEEKKFIGMFVEFKQKTENYGIIQFWCNFGKFNLETKRIDYTYLFLKNQIALSKIINFDIKLSHRYQRKSSRKHINQVSINLECAL